MGRPLVMPRLIVFDLDGTLIDSRRDLAATANQLIEELGGTPLDEPTIGRMIGDGVAALVARTLAAGAGLGADEEFVQRFRGIYNSRLLNHTLPYPGIRELLNTLGRHAELTVLTNKPTESTLKILGGLNLLDPFRLIIGGDGPFPRKPNPLALQYFLDEAELASHQCLLVGDSYVDFQTAQAAASPICMARYGYGYENFPEQELRGNELLIDAPSELLKHLPI